MKKLFTVTLVIIIALSSFAQIPQKMSYQAVIRNSSNQLVTNHVVGLRISILQGSAIGTPVYIETQTPTSNANGLVTIEIGGGTPSTGTLAGIDWSTGTYFIQTEIDPTGGTSYSITGSSQLLSVPYALYAKTSKTANDAANEEYVDALLQYVNRLKDFVNAISPIPTNGLVAYYPFTGNANDMSGNNLNGTVNGATLANDRNGLPNTAYSFYKTKITVPDNSLLDFTNSFSLCAWFNSINKKDTLIQGIIGKPRSGGGTGYGITLANPGTLMGIQPNFPQINFGINNGTTAAGTTYHSDSLTLGWHFVVGTYDGSQIKLYVDGKLKDTKAIAITLQNSGYPLFIGRECGSVDSPTPPGDTVRYFYGKIDDVRLYDRPLNSLEILSLYNEGEIPQLDYEPYVNDIDGNSYSTVKIGTQVWMAENMKTTKYSDGTTIPDGTSAGDISGQYDKKYYFNYGNSSSNGDIYGKLYTWAAAMNGAVSDNSNPGTIQGVCPTNWHLPTDAEWQKLELFLGMSQTDVNAIDWGRGTDQGGQMKEMGTIHWNSPNTGASNSTGLTALPGGARASNAGWVWLDQNAYFWSSTEYSSNQAWRRLLVYNRSDINRNYAEDKAYAFSVRCVKDN